LSTLTETNAAVFV